MKKLLKYIAPAMILLGVFLASYSVLGFDNTTYNDPQITARTVPGRTRAGTASIKSYGCHYPQNTKIAFASGMALIVLGVLLRSKN